MNIFQVLSQGKARLHEPSMSAMLGYLLDSNSDHGLGDAFTRIFLNLVDSDHFSKLLSLDFLNAQASLEEPYQLGSSRKDIDIQLSILDKNKTEIHRIIIENKIKIGAANPLQLSEYYQAILNDDPSLSDLTIIFITPNARHKLLEDEFNNLILSNPKHKKFWINWSSGEKSTSDSLRSLLIQESTGDINPINDYVRHTIKAFIRHCALTTVIGERKSTRSGEDIGEIIDEAIISTRSGTYRVIRRDSSQIQVFSEINEEKEVARRILGQYIDENNLDIDYPKLNTRTIGKKFFDMRRKAEE